MNLVSRVYYFAIVFAVYAFVCIFSGNASAISAESVWTAKTGAAISDIPLAVDGRIYATSADKHLYCWDINSGERFWRTRFKQRLYYSPVYSDGKIAVVETFSTGKIYAVDAGNGDKLWSVEIGKEVCRPVILDGNIIVASDKQLVTLRSADGFVLERVAAGNNISSIYVWNGYLAVVTVSGEIEFYDSESSFISKISLGPGGVFLSPSEDYLYGTTTGGSVFKINEDFDIVWKKECSLPVYRNPIVSGDYVYSIAEGGLIVGLSDSKGEVVGETEITGNIFSYTGFSDGLIMINESGVIYYFDGDKVYNVENGNVKGKFYTPVLSVGDSIYFSDFKGFLYCYKVKM